MYDLPVFVCSYIIKPTGRKCKKKDVFCENEQKAGIQGGYVRAGGRPDQERLKDFRMVLIAPFSSRDTCAWEIPREVATSIWVLPS